MKRGNDSARRGSYLRLRVLVLLALLLLLCGCQREEKPRPQVIPEISGEMASEAAGKLLSGPAEKYSHGICRVTFLDVGQGHATLFQTDEAAVLADGGGRDTSSFVVSWLMDQGVEHLDLIVATHWDADHISGLIGVMNRIPTDGVWATERTEETYTGDSFLKMAEQKNIPVEIPEPLTELTAGRMTFTVLGPFDVDEEIENNNSLVVRMDYGENRVLITGDAQTEEEEAILGKEMDVRAQVLLCGHHGSANSSSAAFLEAVSPRYAVISCGSGNDYGHPHEVLLRRLRACGASIFRTDLQGTVVCELTEDEIRWQVSPWEER